MGLFQAIWLVVRWILMRDPDWSLLPVSISFSIGVVLVAVLAPPGLLARQRHLRGALLRNERVLVLGLIAVVLVAGGVYASLRRFHGDEPASFRAATVVATEEFGDFFTKYGEISWLGKQHPPLMSLIYGVAMRILGIELWVARSITLLFTAATIVVTYALGAEMYDGSTGLTAAQLMLSLPYCLHMGSMANNDMPVTFFFTLSVLLLIRLVRRPACWLAVATGIAIGAGMLTKYTMALVYGVVPPIVVVLETPFRRLLPYLALALLVSAVILSAWLVYAHETGVMSKQIGTVADYVGISSTGTGGLLGAERGWKMHRRIEVMFARLPSAVGAFTVPILLMSLWHLVRSRRQPDRLALAWVAAVSVPIVALLPDSRYFLPAFPALALVMATGLQSELGAAERPTFVALCFGAQALYLYLVLTQSARILGG
jgi:4-amino-4-deoxy-L-arabinose transferase-like glycosyltransferase